MALRTRPLERIVVGLFDAPFEKKKYKKKGKIKTLGLTRFGDRTTTVPRQRRQKCLLVFLNAHRKDPQAHGKTVVALHPEVFRVSYFTQGTVYILLARSSKDNTRVEMGRG